MLKVRRTDVERLYLAASELVPGERQAYLDRECRSDTELRREVEALLAFLETSPSVSAYTSVLPGTQIGPYTIVSFLRAGGMGEVYKGRDTRLDRTVAIKFLPSILAGDAAALERFRREARAASALNHSHICTVHDIGDYHGRPFFVMELLDGQSLSERIAGGLLPTSELVDFAIQSCDALRAAHAKGIVHRDIKPANIFVSPSGQIKILDFGLAKLVEESHPTAATAKLSESEAGAGSVVYTRPGRLMGTPAYLSPEQARNEEVDARTDIFSFGLVLYEMATGRPTFRGQTSGELIRAILSDAPAKPSNLNPTVPGALERIILRAIEKDRNRRYQSAEQLLAELSAFQRLKHRRAVWTARIALAAALVAAVAAVAVGMLSKRLITSVPNIIQRQLTSNPINDSVYSAAITDDGKEIAYTDLRGLHVRGVDSGKVYDISLPPGLCFR
jgi:serine/threonine protein kinase